jgi:NAD(P)-dependent dehydrogenase (short-subunit alcohol dehydrogenase family)
MDLNLTDKIAVVTGASKGIGLAVARELTARSANVAGSDWGDRRRPAQDHLIDHSSACHELHP